MHTSIGAACPYHPAFRYRNGLQCVLQIALHRAHTGLHLKAMGVGAVVCRQGTDVNDR
jgi:hypothetical protein